MRDIVKATLVAGTLDILSAFGFAGLAGSTPAQVLHFVASGPFGDQAKTGAGWAVVGLAVHYAIMACMVLAFFLAAERMPRLVSRPVLAGTGYGVLLWFVMYWVVRPLRWPAMAYPAAWQGLSTGDVAWSIGNALFSHCVLVGIPIAVVAARHVRAQLEN